MAEETHDPTRVPGAPHPRDTARLIGQDAAQAAFLDAFTTGRLHHAWLLSGPRGVGKATLAWRIARFLLAPPGPDPDDMFGAPVPTSLTHHTPAGLPPAQPPPADNPLALPQLASARPEPGRNGRGHGTGRCGCQRP